VISVVLSAFNALSLSPALAAKLLRPKSAKTESQISSSPARSHWRSVHPLQRFYALFNRRFDSGRKRYLQVSGMMIRRSLWALFGLAAIAVTAVLLAIRLPGAFLPEEDQGYAFVTAQLPVAASLERTEEVCKRIEAILKDTPGVRSTTTVEGFSLLSQVTATYNAFFFVTLKPWSERTKAEEKYAAIHAHINRELAKLPQANAFAFSPPSIPGVGTTAGFTFILEDRSGKQDVGFLTQNLERYMEAARKRPELAGLNTTHLPSVPQIFIKVDRDKVLKQGVLLADVYRTLQVFMGGYFVDYFNRFGRQWQVYLEAEEQYRARAENLELFYVRNNLGQSVPISAFTEV
jgi:HAE1 family hydrophobic/amphiphilic exporter-1